MTHIRTVSRSAARLAVSLAALAGFLVLAAMSEHAEVLERATGAQQGEFAALVSTANNLTNAAIIPTIAIAPLAAVAGGFALMIGGGGQRGAGGVKLIGGAIGAVVVVMGARGLAL